MGLGVNAARGVAVAVERGFQNGARRVGQFFAGPCLIVRDVFERGLGRQWFNAFIGYR